MLAVVTGASGGIGEAVAEALAHAGWRVLATGRRSAPLAALVARAPLCVPLTADIATADGRAAIRSWVAVHAAGDLRAIVHNAGTIGPIKPLLEVTSEELNAAMALNVYAPLELTRDLLPLCADGARVLHVSSGAAHSAIAGWGCYCICKAAFFQAYQVLRAEAAAPATATGVRSVLFGSVRPGTVSSGMQDEIRAGSFPAVERFRALHERRAPLEPDAADGALRARPPPKDGLDDPRNVAVFLRWLLSAAPAAEFSAAEWDIRDTAHHAQWVGTAW